MQMRRRFSVLTLVEDVEHRLTLASRRGNQRLDSVFGLQLEFDVGDAVQIDHDVVVGAQDARLQASCSHLSICKLVLIKSA